MPKGTPCEESSKGSENILLVCWEHGYEERNAQLEKEGWKAESALERTFQVRAISIKVSCTKCIIMNVIHINKKYTSFCCRIDAIDDCQRITLRDIDRDVALIVMVPYDQVKPVKVSKLHADESNSGKLYVLVCMLS